MAWTPLTRDAHTRIWEHLNSLADLIAGHSIDVTSQLSPVGSSTAYKVGNVVTLNGVIATGGGSRDAWVAIDVLTVAAGYRPRTATQTVLPVAGWVVEAQTSGNVVIFSPVAATIGPGTYRFSLSWVVA